MEPQIKSEFNAALGMVYRIDAILTETAIASCNMDFPRWFACLGTLNREIKFLLNEVQREELDEYFSKGYQLNINFNANMRWSGEGWVLACHSSQEFLDKNYYSVFYALLNEWDCKVKQYLNNLDLLIKKKMDITQSITNM